MYKVWSMKRGLEFIKCGLLVGDDLVLLHIELCTHLYCILYTLFLQVQECLVASYTVHFIQHTSVTDPVSSFESDVMADTKTGVDSDPAPGLRPSWRDPSTRAEFSCAFANSDRSLCSLTKCGSTCMKI